MYEIQTKNRLWTAVNHIDSRYIYITMQTHELPFYNDKLVPMEKSFEQFLRFNKLYNNTFYYIISFYVLHMIFFF